MAEQIEFSSLSFDDAIAFFRQKVNLPTGAWTDLWEEMHSRAFVVAGATKSELLADLKSAIDKAISEGTTLDDFRKAFDEIVSKHGWSYKGSRGWRTATIYNTNLRTAYASGHYKQMTEPAVLKARPYWRYVAVLDGRVRPLHRSWHGTILPAKDQWWNTHYPPNGWNCRCAVVSLSRSEMERDGLSESERPNDGTFEWTNPKTGEIVNVPNGIDPGWAYNPGKAAWGERISHDTMRAWQLTGAGAWEKLTPGNWQTYGRPEILSFDAAVAEVGRKIAQDDIEAEIRKIIAGDEKVYSFIEGQFRYDVLVNAKTLAAHIDPARDMYLPFLPETIIDPNEVWMSFERHRGTGKTVLRLRIIKAIDIGGGKGMLLVTNVVDGVMEAWTFIPISNMDYLNKQRTGKLIWERK